MRLSLEGCPRVWVILTVCYTVDLRYDPDYCLMVMQDELQTRKWRRKIKRMKRREREREGLLLRIC